MHYIIMCDNIVGGALLREFAGETTRVGQMRCFVWPSYLAYWQVATVFMEGRSSSSKTR